MKYLLIIVLLLNFYPAGVAAGKPVSIQGHVSEYKFIFGDLEYLEDPDGKLTISDVCGNQHANRFMPSTSRYPRNKNVHSTWWFRIRVNYKDAGKQKYLLEFFNHTVHELTAYLPDTSGNYIGYQAGVRLPFARRLFNHKNFEFELPQYGDGTYTYYFRLKSFPEANVIVVHRSVQRFIGYALTEYLYFGLFYGMILMFSFYNLLMFTVMRKRQYVWYVLYLLSVAMYEMNTDGIAYQYLWPNSLWLAKYGYGVALFFLSIFNLLFALDLLHVRTRAPRLYRLIQATIITRVGFFAACLFYNPQWFNYRVIEFIPLAIAFYTGIYIWRKGYKPARFFVLAYSFLALGFIVKLLVSLGFAGWINGPIPHYSMSLGFILEMVFLSFAIGDKLSMLKKKKEKAQQRIIEQMRENALLKDSMNRELENKVEERTREIIRKTEEIREKSDIIEQQNEELLATNHLLHQQAEEIARMNLLLQKDNQELQSNIQKVTHDRVMSAEVDFEEFSKAYPDRETCFSLLAELKWKGGYTCKKCGSTHYCSGQMPYSRRCTKCRYEESVIANTILQNTRIPVNKAFYMIFLIYSTRGKISSHKLSEITGIRQSTCWMYSSKIKKVMEERKKELRKAGKEGWSKLVL